MSKIPPLTLEDLGVPTPEINREFIKRINQGLEYLTNRIADLQGDIADIKLLLEHIKDKERKT